MLKGRITNLDKIKFTAKQKKELKEEIGIGFLVSHEDGSKKSCSKGKFEIHPDSIRKFIYPTNEEAVLLGGELVPLVSAMCAASGSSGASSAK